MILRTFLRTKLHTLRVSSIEATEDSIPGSIILCPRLCWAAEIAELEQVEVVNLLNGTRFPATVLIGEVGEVRIPEGGVFGFEIWGPVALTATTTAPSHQIAEHTATIVLVDQRRNAALEIRRQAARPVLREPSFHPLPDRREEVVPIASAHP